MAEKRVKKKYIVVFQDEEGNVLKTAFTASGETAEAPDVPKKKSESEHHEVLFQGWDHDISAVRENLVVKPVYQEIPKSYIVMYLSSEGKMIGMESVPYGEAARADYRDVKPGNEAFYYEFEGWDADLSRVEKDTMVHSIFREIRRTYSVGFYHESGRLLKDCTVPYGEAAVPPEQVTKNSDHIYSYRFAGWDGSYDRITEDRKLYAQFEPIFINYEITFADNGQEIAAGRYHYEEAVQYPSLRKKGYTLSWEPAPEKAVEDARLEAVWTFANPVGQKKEIDKNRYEIIDPSASHGSVALRKYISLEKTVTVPQQVKIGDYYYRIVRIEKEAFAECVNMQRLILPDTVAAVAKQGLGGCIRLREISFGKGLKRIGDRAFAGDRKLKKITFAGKDIERVSRRAFDGLPRMTEIVVPGQQQSAYEKKFVTKYRGRIRG